MMKNERLLAYLFASFAGYYLIANISIYKSFLLVAIAFIVIVIGYTKLGKKYKSNDHGEPILFFLAWLFTFLWALVVNGDSLGFGAITILSYNALYLNLNRDYQLAITKLFIWGLSFLFFFSVVEYLIFLTTGAGFVLENVTRTTLKQSTFFYHLVFNIIQISDRTLRFQGLADEPGQMGTFCGMVLFLVKKLEMNKFPFYIFLISGLLSFSLAFYILLLIFLLSNIKDNYKSAIVMIVFMSIVLWHFQEQFNEKIIERISNTDKIDNRTGEVFDALFLSAVITGKIWFGVGGDNISKMVDGLGEGCSGAKVFLLQYGVICFVVLFLMYNYIYIKRCRGNISYYEWLFLVAFWLSFYQRQAIYFPFNTIIFFTIPITQNVARFPSRNISTC